MKHSPCKKCTQVHSVFHGLRTPNEGINQRYLKNWADVADKLCFGRGLHLIYNLHVIHACIMCRFAHRSVHTRQICLCTLHSHMLLVASNLQPTHMYHVCMYHVQICTKMSTRQICLCTVELLNPIIFKFSEK